MMMESSGTTTMADTASCTAHTTRVIQLYITLQTQEASAASEEDPVVEVEELSSFPLLFYFKTERENHIINK